MQPEPVLLRALVYLGAGVLAVPLAKRCGLGAVLGYLLAGVAIGPHVLGLAGDESAIADIAQYGVVILLFLIGLEVRPALLWQLRFSIFGLGAAQLAGSALAVALAGVAGGLAPRAALVAGIVLAMSSTAIVLATLDERGLRRGAVGQASFGVLLFQDLAVIPLFAILPVLAGAHPAASRGGFGLPPWERGLAILGAVALVVAGGRYLTRPAFRFIASARLREIFTATALLLVVAVASLMQLVGLSPALGAFLAGVMLAESEFRRVLEADIEPFRGLLLGLFFMTVGAGLDLRLLVTHAVLLAALVGGLVVLKGAAMFAIGRAAGLPRRDAGAVAAGLAGGGEFAFVLIGLLAAGGSFAPAALHMLSAVVALSMIATPVVFGAWERIARATFRPTDAAAPADQPFARDVDVILAGYGRVGQVVGRLLQANGFTTSVVDLSMTTIETARALGRQVNYGDATRLDLLEAAGAARARVLVVAIDDRERAAELVDIARESFPHLAVIARAWDRRDAYELLRRGAGHVERESYEGSLALGRAALRALGMRAHRAVRAAAIFRTYDTKLFDKLRPTWEQNREGFILASRESAAMFGRLLESDIDAIGADSATSEWDSAAPPEEERGSAPNPAGASAPDPIR
jgi:monovalent cation:proton antiporter-2 (CPA2) family protein